MAVVAVALALAACKGEGGGAPTAERASTSATSPTTTSLAASAASASASAAPRAQIDALTMKLYRADLCLFASLGLRHLREAYLASLAGAAPGPGHVPSFDKASRVDHERQARTCAPGYWSKEPTVAGLDAVMATFAPTMAELAEEIEEGSEYYALGQHERDAFAKGKRNHAKLVLLFGKLDAGQDALAAALEAWRAAHPVELGKLEPGERVVTIGLDASRALGLALVNKAPEKVVTPLVGAVEVATKAADDHAKAHPDDPWSRAARGLAAFHAAATAAAAKGAGSDARLAATDALARLVEVVHLARASALLAKAKAP
jgi:hypothetical protein